MVKMILKRKFIKIKNIFKQINHYIFENIDHDIFFYDKYDGE